MDKVDLDQLIDLAFAVEDNDPIDWGAFRQGREQAMRMIGASILEQFDKESYDQDDKLIMLSVITKLVTENMILHSRCLKYSQRTQS